MNKLVTLSMTKRKDVESFHKICEADFIPFSLLCDRA